jgi:hypothetical protein
MGAIRADYVCGGDRLAILERNIHETAIIGIVLHVHKFVRAEDRDSDFLQLFVENILSLVLREENVEGKAGLPNQPVVVHRHQKRIISVVEFH